MNERKEYIVKLLNGEEAPANSSMAYLVDRLRSVMQEGVSVEKRLNEINQEKNELEIKFMGLSALTQSYQKDIAFLSNQSGE